MVMKGSFTVIASAKTFLYEGAKEMVDFKEGELDKNTSVEIFDRSESKASRPPKYYNLDVIISVGYRVKSK